MSHVEEVPDNYCVLEEKPDPPRIEGLHHAKNINQLVSGSQGGGVFPSSLEKYFYKDFSMFPMIGFHHDSLIIKLIFYGFVSGCSHYKICVVP
jgi:hypothetical protein